MPKQSWNLKILVPTPHNYVGIIGGSRVRPIIGYTDITNTDTDNRYRYQCGNILGGGQPSRI